MPVKISNHPLVRHKLGKLRDKRTPPVEFRELVHDLSMILCVEATADLSVGPGTVRTPLADCPTHILTERVGIFPILRAGLGMAEAMIKFLPDACIWHLGLFRDEETLRPVTYYNKLPSKPRLDLGLIVDPMLATGGSIDATIRLLKDHGLTQLKYIGLIAAPEGVKRIEQDHPDITLYLGAVDDHLDERGYIVPGLGDAGDRQFGTVHTYDSPVG